VIRNYPEFPVGSQRWDDRIFHPDENGGPHRPISALWKGPPAYVEQILGCVRLLESAVVQRFAERIFRPAALADLRREVSAEIAALAPEAVASEAVSSKALS
jgi:hypothetical protein